MTEKERLLAVLNGQPVDRPPVICPGGMMSAATTEVLRQANGDFHTDPAVMARTAENIRTATGFENLGVPFCLTVEAEHLGSRVDLGDAAVEPRITAYGAGEPAAVTARPLPDWTGRVPVVLEAITGLARRNKDIPITGNLTGPVSLATSLLDPLLFFRLLRKDPAGIHLLLDYLTQYLEDFARRQIAAGADVVAVADPTATGEILGSRNFREFVSPYLTRLVGTIRAAGAAASSTSAAMPRLSSGKSAPSAGLPSVSIPWSTCPRPKPGWRASPSWATSAPSFSTRAARRG